MLINKDKPTSAQIFFKDKQVLTARPEGMDFEEYKFLRKHQNAIMKGIFAKDPMYKVRRPRVKARKKSLLNKKK